MKKVYEFAGLSKSKKNELRKDYIKRKWKGLLVSYIFIILSSSKPFFSSKNGALFVLIWFTLSNALFVYVYVEQSDYMKRYKRAKRYSKKHKNIQVEHGAFFFPKIDGWDSYAMQLLVAILFYFVVLPILYLQFKNLGICKEDYRNLATGIIIDTYIVAFFNITLQFIIDFIYDCANKRINLKKAIFSQKLTDIVAYVGMIILFISAFTYYFNKEFEGLLGDMGKIMGGIYIIFMLFPLIKCLIEVSNNKRKVYIMQN